VGADNRFDREAMTANQVQDARDFVSGIDDQRLARGGIADNGAIALKHPNRDGDVNQPFCGGIQGGQAVIHAHKYSIACPQFRAPRSVPCGAL